MAAEMSVKMASDMIRALVKYKNPASLQLFPYSEIFWKFQFSPFYLQGEEDFT